MIMAKTSQKSLPAFAVKQNSSPTIPRRAISSQNTSALSSKKSILPPRKPSTEYIAEVFPSESPPHVVDDVIPQAVDLKPRTIEDIIEFSEGDKDDEQSDTDESIDIIDIKPNVKFLPATVDGWQTDSTNCSRNSCDRENMNIETNLSFCWMSCYDKMV